MPRICIEVTAHVEGVGTPPREAHSTYRPFTPNQEKQHLLRPDPTFTIYDYAQHTNGSYTLRRAPGAHTSFT